MSGKTVCAHVKNALSKIRKQDLSSLDISSLFPFPLVEDVDSDSWIDLRSIDELETKMSELTGISQQVENDDRKASADIKLGRETDLKDMNNMMAGLESFVNTKSAIEGISTKTNGLTSPRISDHPKLFNPMEISPKIFLSMFHKVLEAESHDGISNIFEINDTVDSSNDEELLKYFSREDLDFDDRMEEDSDGNSLDGDNECEFNRNMDVQVEDGMASLTDIMVRIQSFIHCLIQNI